MKTKKILSGFISLLIVLSVINVTYIVYATDFDESDIETLKNIYNQNENAKVLGWEFNAPEIEVDREAFSCCRNLKTIVNTDSIIYIEKDAFKNCDNLVFYGKDEDSYAAEYAEKNGITFKTDLTVTAICYLGIMMKTETDTVDLTDGGKPYRTGYISISDNDFYSDGTGRIELTVQIGRNQCATIGGNTALKRKIIFDVLYDNYEISSLQNAIGIVICEYNRDGYINVRDFTLLMRYTPDINNKDNYCYDINEDLIISEIDESYFSEFLNVYSDTVYHLWR